MKCSIVPVMASVCVLALSLFFGCSDSTTEPAASTPDAESKPAQAPGLEQASSNLTEPDNNLINHPSLEGAALGEHFPPGWGSFNAKPKGTYRFEVVEGGRTGTKSCSIEGDGQRITMPTNRVSIDSSKRYVAQGWVKLEGSASSAQVCILYFDASRRYIGGNRHGHVTPHDEWQLVTVTDRIKEHPNARYLALAMTVMGKGKAVFDDLELLAFDIDNLPSNFESEYGRTVSRESRVLDRWLGQWESTTSHKPTDASTRADEMVGISNVAKILDDRILQSHWTSEDGDEEILSLLTHDDNSAAYRLWTFSSSSAALEFAGQWDDATSTLTLQVVPHAPGVTGTSITRFVDADTIKTRLTVKNKAGVVTRDVEDTLIRKSKTASSDIPPADGTLALSPELRPLQRFIGAWDLHVAIKIAEWAPEGTTMEGDATTNWILRGRVIEHRVIWSPDSTHGLSLIAYDTENKVYRQWYFDSNGTIPRDELQGAWDEATKTITWKGRLPNGITGTGDHHFIDNDTYEWSLTHKDRTGKVVLLMKAKAKRKSQD